MGVQIPLTSPAQPITAHARVRHRRTWLVNGIDLVGQARLRAARVLVVGAGGLGSPVLLYLAGAGVGTIAVADHDLVEEHNLGRQVVHGQASIGQPKTASARTRLLDLDPEVQVVEIGQVTTELLDQQRDRWDLVMECSDTFDTTYLVADWCERGGTPLVWGSVIDMVWQVSDFWSRPPDGWAPTSLRSLYPRPPEPGQTPSSTEVGVLGPVVGQAGSAMATEAVKLITGAGEPLLGQVLYGDARRNSYHVLTFAGRP